jgi:hypothetical protein
MLTHIGQYEQADQGNARQGVASSHRYRIGDTVCPGPGRTRIEAIVLKVDRRDRMVYVGHHNPPIFRTKWVPFSHAWPIEFVAASSVQTSLTGSGMMRNRKDALVGAANS